MVACRAILVVWVLWIGHVTCVLTVKGKSFPSLINVTIDDLQRGLDGGLFSSVDLVKAYVARILEVNDTLHVVTELNPDALEIAAHLDALRSKGKNVGPLHGIPILIKNNIATKDKMNNTAGSYALLGSKVATDSFVAQKLRKAGAIILGKANLSQWANYRSSNSSSGWSAYGGQVYGAYYPEMDPSGSSSGSGVASSIGLALATLGTETSGSIISPAQKGNLVGIKPTVGLTSRHLVIPISSHQDTIGPMARTVKDAAVILKAIAGYDVKDNYTNAIPNNHKIPDYPAACKPGALKGARIGIPFNILNLTQTAELDAFNAAVAIMKVAGAEIVTANFTAPNATTNSTVLQADFVSDLAAYLAELTYNPHNITSLKDLQQYTHTDPREAWPDRDTATWDSALALGYNNSDWRFWAALQQNYFTGGEGGLLGAVARNNVSAIVMPSSQSPGRAAIVGAPIVTVPLGAWPAGSEVKKNARGLATQAPNIPFGLSFLGAKFSEETLIGLAYDFERLTMMRAQIQPYIVPKTEIGDIAGH